jgi:subtilisin family serine protease
VALLLTTVSGQQPPAQAGVYVPGEVLVQFSAGATAFQRNAIVVDRGASRIRRFETLDIDHLRLPAGLSVEAALAALKATPGVVAAQPNYIRRAIQTAPPNDPFWLDGSLWGLTKIKAQQAWSNFTAGDGTVVIADIDTGIDYTHPDLAANMWQNPVEVAGNGIDDDGNGYVDDVYGIDTVNHDTNPMDDQGHGTHTSGTIAAVGNNGLGVVGVNWNARLLACKFLDASGFGTEAGAVECFNYIVALRNRGVNIRVSSNSWGSARGAEPPAQVLINAIDGAGAAGIINIFGAGNDGLNNDNTPFDPASYPVESIVAVASSGPTDRRSFFSNYGATSVDLAAPGEQILSTYPGGDYIALDGTSMATPHVAGAAALLAKMDPTLSVAAIKALLLDNVDKSSRWNGRVVSGGRLNVFKAASAVGTGGSNIPPSVSLTTPAEGATFKVPVNITLEATASDSDGSVASVAFYANGAPIGIDTTSPYGVTWTNAPDGVYTLTSVAADNLGATTASAPVHITVLPNAPPVVSITSPADGTTFDSPATVTIDATASDSDGSIQQVAFYANGALIGVDATTPFSVTWNPAMGAYALTAVATDDFGTATTSAAVGITINPIPGRINVARAASGGVATASSMLTPNYPPAGAIDGDRRGLNWGAGGGWNDGTQNAGPDWLEVRFAGSKLIEEVNVFSLQDAYGSPVEPTPTMTFTLWGLSGFEVQYWDGASWAAVPGGTVTNNTLVWRRIVFAPLATTRIRVFVTAPLNGYSRVIEAEAWGVADGSNAPPNVAIDDPADGASFTAPATITIDAAATDDDGSVQQVDFFANGAPIGSATSSPFSLTWGNVAVGAYTLTAVATDNLGATTTSAPVTVTVAAANVPPSVSITSPASGSTFGAPANITVTAIAGDSDGSVASVAFFANGLPIGTDNTSPYSIAWSNVAAGAYALTAVATDNLGATTTSAAVDVMVNTVSNRINMALAANGGVATASSTYTPNYPASGAINGDRRGLNWGAGGGWNDGTANQSPDWLQVDFNGLKVIDEVDVFSLQDAYSSPVEPTPTLTFTLWGLAAFQVQYWTGAGWSTVPGGSVTNNNLVWRRVVLSSPVTTTKIRINITGALNGYSRVIELEAWGVPASGNAPPNVSIDSPAGGATFGAPANITITASASDIDGTIQQVAFFANGAPVGTDNTSPYSIVWSNVAVGAYALTAVATDNQGGTTTSAAVNVSVIANSPPSVSITSPAAGTTFTAPATITINATASDTGGSIQQVAFFANDAPVGTDTTSPYSISWINVPGGTYSLTAVATDNLGATTTSAAVSVTVNVVPGRANMALAANGGVASASSTLTPNYPASGAINGDRRGVGWGAGGGWNDGTSNAGPDWIQVDFNGLKVIDEVNVFSMQDNYSSPAEPTPTMTFTLWGLAAFQVQYWDGAAWVNVPGASVTNNNLVWRRFVLATPVTTTKIRVHITGALNGYSRVIEVEALGVPANAPEPLAYSARSAVSGSTDTARRAGTTAAIAAMTNVARTRLRHDARGRTSAR